MITELEQFQQVEIDGQCYTVTGMIAYAQDGWHWKEYLLQAEGGSPVWLSIEIDDGEVEYILYRSCRPFGNRGDYEVSYQGRTYQQYEVGTARVTGYFGRVDVDRNERVNFWDYKDPASDSYLSLEDWEGEREYSEGRELDSSEIRLLATKGSYVNSGSYNKEYKSNKKKFIVPVIISSMIIAAMIFVITRFMDSDSIQDYLEESEKYTYVTSITNSTNNKKARVYSSSMDVNNAVQDIIRSVPDRVDSVLESEDENGESGLFGEVGILGNDEYVYVYTSQNGKTYLQVSSEKFMEGQENAYDSGSYSRSYYRTYARRRSHTRFAGILSSARQESVSSRKSSGGGTSVGK